MHRNPTFQPFANPRTGIPKKVFQPRATHKPTGRAGDKVLNGDIDPCIKTYLMQKASGTLDRPSADAEDD